MHNHSFARLEWVAVASEIVRRQALEQHCCGELRGNFVWQADELCKRHGNQFGIGPRAVGETNSRARRIRRVGRRRVDHAGPFFACDERRRADEMRVALAALNIGEVQPDRLHPHDDMSGLR